MDFASISLLILLALLSKTFDHPIEAMLREFSSPNDADDCTGQPGMRTSYLRTEGLFRLLDLQLPLQSSSTAPASPPSLATFEQQSLEQCAQKCTERKECRAFEFHSEHLECTLRANPSQQPFGLEALHQQKADAGDGQQTDQQMAHFQRICLPVEHLCNSSAHSFERFPQHVLVGHASEVFPLSTLPECLAACLAAKRVHGLDCRSAMFLPRDRQCLLNSEQRRSVPARLFRPEIGANLMVDYFDNVCADVECLGGEQLHWIRSEHFQIDPAREVILPALSLENCKQVCMENRVRGGNFPCRAFAHHSAGSRPEMCHLSAESAILSPASRERKEEAKRRRRRKIDMRNFSPANSVEKIPLDSELSFFSAGQYFEKICLPPTKKESTNVKFDCERDEPASFELVTGRKFIFNAKILQVLPSRSTGACLRACLSTENCLSVQFNRQTERCILSAQLGIPSASDLFRRPDEDATVDSYNNLCVPRQNESIKNIKDQEQHHGSRQQSSESSKTHQNAQQLASTTWTQRSATGKQSPAKRKARPVMLNNGIKREEGGTKEDDEQGGTATDLLVQDATTDTDVNAKDQKQRAQAGGNVRLDTDCRRNAGIQVRAHFPAPSSGTLFLRDRAAYCSASFREALEATLLLSSPNSSSSSSSTDGKDASKCAGTQIGPHLWSFVVVLRQQQKELGRRQSDQISGKAELVQFNAAQLHLLTGQERLFNVTCDFGSNAKTPKDKPSHHLDNDSRASPRNELSPVPEPTAEEVALLYSPPPPPVALQMVLLRAGQPVSAVSLGEQLELRWSFDENSSNNGGAGQQRLGMYVDSCVAERMDGQPPDPPPLSLIVNGCPEPRARAANLVPALITPLPADRGFNTTLRIFRFDGSRRVRIRCAVDICVERCPPANCSAKLPSKLEEAEELSAEASFGSRRRRRRRRQLGNDEGGLEPAGLTTLGELAELVDRYDRLRSAALTAAAGAGASESASAEQQKGAILRSGKPSSSSGGGGAGASAVQQSTTISGSYTIAQEAENLRTENAQRNGQSHGQQGTAANNKSGKRPPVPSSEMPSHSHQRGPAAATATAEDVRDEIADLANLLRNSEAAAMGKKHKSNGNGEAEAGRSSAGNAQAANDQQQQQQLPIPFAGQKKQSRINFGGGNVDDEEEEEERRSGPLSACDESSSPSSTGAWLCLNRPLAASLGLIFLLLAIGQLFQLIRWIRRQNQHKIGNKNAKELEEEEMVHLPDPTHPPPPPCCSVAHSQSSVVENLHRADLSYRRYSNNVFCLLCNNPPQFCRCGECDGGGVEVERNRRQSYLSIETPMIARPVAQPRTQTVFPAEPYNSSSSGSRNGGHRKSANNGTGPGRDQQQQRWEEHVSF